MRAKCEEDSLVDQKAKELAARPEPSLVGQREFARSGSFKPQLNSSATSQEVTRIAPPGCPNQGRRNAR